MSRWQFWRRHVLLPLRDIDFLTNRLIPFLLFILNVIAITVALTYSLNSSKPLQWSSVMIFAGFWAFLIILLITGRTMLHCKGRRREVDEENGRDLVRKKWLEKAPARQTPSWRGGDEEHLRNARVWEAMDQPHEKVFQPYRPGFLPDEAARLELDAGFVFQPTQADIQYWSTAQKDSLSACEDRPIRPCGLVVDKPLPPRPRPAYIRDSSCSRADRRSSHSARPLPPTPRLSLISTLGTEIFEEDLLIPSPSSIVRRFNLTASVCQGIVPQILDARRVTLVPEPDRQPAAAIWKPSSLTESNRRNTSLPPLKFGEDELAATGGPLSPTRNALKHVQEQDDALRLVRI